MCKNGKPETTFGIKILRPPECRTPCEDCPKMPPDVPATPYHATECNGKDWATWEHYKRCRAVGEFPDDPATRYMAGLFLRLEEQVQDEREAGRFFQLGRTLMAAAALRGMKGG